MQEVLETFATYSTVALELAGIAVIVVAGVLATFVAAVRWARGSPPRELYRAYRLHLGHGILLGLEFLVAADIIDTVALDLTIETLGVLAAVVLVRTFLSFTLEVEMTGKWPWQQEQEQEL